MGEMAARRQIQAHEGVARIEQRQEHRLVHLAAGIGLDIGEAGAEQLLGALDRQGLDHVHIFAAAVIAFARIAFGIFVGQHRALGFQHRLGDDVLGGDQLDLVAAGGPARRRCASATSGSASARPLVKKPEFPDGSVRHRRHHPPLFELAVPILMGTAGAGGFTPSPAPNLARHLAPARSGRQTPRKRLGIFARLSQA